ncbi:MAG: hypothetical protein E6Q72_08705 [Pseudomonas sp.]|nr:MAG: hypothetical protein E6Q72_08705 [Pseudomonas sp.]
MLRPIEKGHMTYRSMRGLPTKYHARLKVYGRTLAILQGDTQEEANERAGRLAAYLLAECAGVTIQPA